MLDVEGRDDVDPRVQELLDVLPALLVAGAGDVGVGQLVHQGDLGVPLQQPVEVHLLEDLAPVFDAGPREDLEVTDLRPGIGPVIGLDVADDDVLAPRVGAPPLVEHGVGLADARGRSQVDPELATRHGPEP